MGAVVSVCCTAREGHLGDNTPATDLHTSETLDVKQGSVHMLIVALDYPGTGNELTCTVDGGNMKELATACGCKDLTVLVNKDGNKARVIKAIQDIGKRCNPGEFFVFNYSGHGANVPDKDGDEEDGQDEALCLVTTDGKISWPAFLTDDEFAEVVTSSVPAGVNILVLCDCCHSGTIGDFTKPCWENHPAVSMSGCTDNQTSGDTGKGGIFTHSLLMAVEDMQKNQKTTYSVAQLYNEQLKYDDKVFKSKQDITIMWSKSLSGPEAMTWPFPAKLSVVYTAPWNRQG